MRRNTVTFLKYLILAFLAVSFLVITINLFSSQRTVRPVDSAAAHFQNQLFPKESDQNADSPQKALAVAAGDPLELIDWHNYTQIKLESERSGPGEQGNPVEANPAEKDEYNRLFAANGFSGLTSDKISLHRAIRDIRHSSCKNERYQRSLPSVSIVIPFYEEHFSTLLRTVYSCVERAPSNIVKEVILVDDGSNKEFLKKQLDDYVKEHFTGFTSVRVMRQKQREGLIRTRLLGARNATGDVIIFLDSHCECNVNYLPPLLHPIAQDYRTVVCPFIDVIDHDNFHYRAQDEGARGSWDWELYYKRLPLLPEDLKHPSKPFKSPVMAGGLFAISAKWFWELGGYDPQLDIWGGEQYELSFKLWQCGGQMVDAPCSRIGHIYRKYSPFSSSGHGDFLARNYKRVAEVWMDEYKEYIYIRRPHYRQVDAGDLTEQRALRTRLNCKSFKWFMTNIAFDQPIRYPPIEPPLLAEGDIRPAADNSLCIDALFRGTMQRFPLSHCIRGSQVKEVQGGEQQFEFTFRRDIRPRKRNVCFDASETRDGAPVLLYDCHGQKGNQHWRYNPDTKAIYHVVSQQCLDADINTQEVMMRQCDSSRLTQQWTWQTIKDVEILRKDWL